MLTRSRHKPAAAAASTGARINHGKQSHFPKHGFACHTEMFQKKPGITTGKEKTAHEYKDNQNQHGCPYHKLHFIRNGSHCLFPEQGTRSQIYLLHTQHGQSRHNVPYLREFRLYGKQQPSVVMNFRENQTIPFSFEKIVVSCKHQFRGNRMNKSSFTAYSYYFSFGYYFQSSD